MATLVIKNLPEEIHAALRNAVEHEHSEVVNVLWKYVSLRGMELSLALEILQACRSLMAEREFPIGTDEALLLACESGCCACFHGWPSARHEGPPVAT
jgi:plasmid stability protein